jgi:hypothetical protein
MGVCISIHQIKELEQSTAGRWQNVGERKFVLRAMYAGELLRGTESSRSESLRKGSSLQLNDVAGHTRIMLRVAEDGTPIMQFLDAAGKVTSQWPAAK